MIEALKINISMLFNLDFSYNTMSPCFFFLITDLYFLIPAVIVQFFNFIQELVFPIGMTTKEAKEEMKTHLDIVELN